MPIVEKQVAVQLIVSAATARSVGMTVDADIPDCALMSSKGVVLQTFLHDDQTNTLMVQMLVIQPSWQHANLKINEPDAADDTNQKPTEN